MNQPFACVAERPAAPASPVAVTLADALVDVFTRIGVRHAFGVSGGFVAHIALPTGLQASRCDKPPRGHASSRVCDESAQLAADVAPLLAATPFAIWLGFGARGAAAAVRALAEHTGAPVFCSPRGKGIFPEDHAQFVVVTGIGGHDAPPHF